MTTTKEFIEYLQTLPPETEVKVLREYTHGYSVCTEYIDLDVDKYSDNCEYLKPTLYLGEGVMSHQQYESEPHHFLTMSKKSRCAYVYCVKCGHIAMNNELSKWATKQGVTCVSKDERQ